MKKKLFTLALISLLCACGGANNSSSSNSSSEPISSESISSEIPTNIDDFEFEKTSLGVLAINEDGGLTISKYTCKRGSTVKVKIPETYKDYKITRIAKNAFSFAGGIKTVTLSKNIKHCASKAFSGCTTLLGIYVDDANNHYSSRNDLLYSKDGKTIICGPNGKNEVLIDANTEIISDYAFSDNSTKIFTFEEGVHTFGNRAFENSKKATSFTMPNSVKTLGEYVFANSDFKELKLGTGITTLPSYTVYQCPSLTKLVVPGNIKTIEYSAIGDNQHLSTLILEEGVENVGEYAVSFNSYLSNISLPTSLRTIGKCGFISLPSLKSIVVPEGVVSIGDGAFSHSTLLKTIQLPSTVSEIGQGINQYCTDFEGFVLAEGNEYFVLEDSALYSKDMTRLLAVPQFYGEPGYHTFTVPSTVETIGNYAFNYSVRISKVVLPKTLTAIGAGLFVNSAVKELEFLGTKEEWNAIEKKAIVELEQEIRWNTLSSILEVICVDGSISLVEGEVIQ